MNQQKETRPNSSQAGDVLVCLIAKLIDLLVSIYDSRVAQSY